jgi:hypothetical protein
MSNRFSLAARRLSCFLSNKFAAGVSYLWIQTEDNHHIMKTTNYLLALLFTFPALYCAGQSAPAPQVRFELEAGQVREGANATSVSVTARFYNDSDKPFHCGDIRNWTCFGLRLSGRMARR